MKNFLKKKMLKRILLASSLLIVMVGGIFVYQARAVVGITAATGATNISIDTTSGGGTGAWTALGSISGPVISEGAVGEINTGIHTLTLPAGWEFNTGQNVTIGLGGGTELTLGASVVTPSATAISFNVTAQSTATPAVLTFSNLQVRPTGTAVSSGDMVHSGAAISGVNGSTNFGTFSTVHGTVTKVRVETAANGSGSVVAAQDLASGATLTVYGVTRDQFNNYVSNPADTTWTLTGKTGGVADGDLVGSPAANVALTGNLVGSAVIHAVNNALTTGDSGTITVVSGAAASVTMDQQPAAVGTVDVVFSTQPWVIVKDANNNPVSGVVVTASLASGSGTLRGTLTATSGADGKAKFTDLGYNKIDAFQLHFAAGALSVDANAFGPLTHGAATKYTVINPTDGTVDAAISVTVQLQDQYGNLVSTGADKDKDVTLVTDGAATGGGVVNIANGTGSLPISDQTAQTVNLTLSTPVLAGADVTSTQNVVFAHGAATKYVITNPTDGTVDADITVTVQLLDQYNNRVTTGADTDKDVDLAATGAATGEGTVNITAGVGSLNIADHTAQTVTFTLINPVLVGADVTSSEDAIFAPGATHHLAVTGVTDPVVAGVASGVTVTAQDQYNNTTPAYTGTIHFTSTDVKGTTVLPGDHAFVGGDNGVHAFAGGVTLTTIGEQTVSAADTVTGSIAGAQTAVTVTAAAASKVNVETAANGSGSVVTSQSLASGGTLTVYGVTRDQYDNFVANPADTAWTLTGKTGGVADGDLVGSPAANVTLTGNLAGTAVIHAANGVLTAGDSGTITVTNGPATKYVITNPADGTVDAPITVTVQLLDANNNRVTTGASKDIDVTLTADGAATGAGVVDIVDGIGTLAISDHTAQTVNLGLSDSSLTLLDVTSTQNVVFAHGVSAKYTIINPVDGTVDAAINVTVQLQDQYGNIVSTGADKDKDVDLVASGAATGEGTVDIANGTGLLAISDQTAQTVTFTLANPVAAVNIDSTENVVFAHGAATKYVITDPTDGTVDAAITVTVQLLDQYNNRVTSGALTDNDVVLTTDNSATGAGTLDITAGVGTLAISDQVAETVALGLTDMGTGLNVTSTQNVVFAPGATHHLTVTGVTDPVAAGTASGVTVTAKDQYNNTTPAYTGTVHFTSTDVKGTTVLPGDHAFVGGDNGAHAFGGGITLTTTGEQTVTATDTVTGSITGNQSAITVTPAAANKLALSASPTSLAAGSNSTLTALVQDQYGNTVTTDNTTFITFTSEGHSTWAPHGGLASSGVKTSVLSNNTTESVDVSITSNPWLTPPADVTVNFTSNSITPTITLDGAAMLSTYTVSEANTRFASGLTFTLTNDSSATVNGSTVVPAAHILTAASNAAAKTLGAHTYHAVVTSSTGNTAEATVSYQVTADPAENTPPNVSAQNPLDNTTSVAASVSPTVTFDEAMDASTVNTNTIQLRAYAGDAIVNSVVTYDVATRVATVNPVANLSNSTQYYLWVSGAKDVAGNTVTAYTTKAAQEFTTVAAGVGTFGITSTTMTKMTGTADDSYANGWEWVIRMTLPTDQNDFALKFNNWVSGSNSLPTANNMQYYSEQIAAGTGSAGSPITITAANTYPSNVTVSTDADANTDGIQTDIHVKVKIPAATSAGSYSTSYRVNYE